MDHYPELPPTLKAFGRLTATLKAEAGIATRRDATVTLSGAPPAYAVPGAHASFAWA